MLADLKLEIEDSIRVKQSVLQDEHLLHQLQALIEATIATLKHGGCLFLAGNGGSFADAQHLAAEFTSRFKFDRAPLCAQVLGANASAISAIGNDYGFDQVFSRELKANGRAGDVFVGITTSGNSVNILRAVEAAREIGIEVFIFTGGNGGKVAEMAECLVVPSGVTARIQESHILLGHLMCGAVESAMFKGTHT